MNKMLVMNKLAGNGTKTRDMIYEENRFDSPVVI